MSGVIIGRPIDGITLNWELEFLLDDAGRAKVFADSDQAASFLLGADVDLEELRHMVIMENHEEGGEKHNVC